MKKIIFIVFSFMFLYGGEYSIIAFSSKKFDKKAAEIFIKRFPNGIVKKYTRFVEYKIEPFKSYAAAKKFIIKVKKYYKYPLIVPYRPNLGVILYPLKNLKVNTAHHRSISTKGGKFIHCVNKCGCIKNRDNSWELNNTKIISKIDVKIKKYMFNENNGTEKNTTTNFAENNTTVNFVENNNIAKSCYFPPVSDHFFYIDLYGNLFRGQKNDIQLRGNTENIKLGFIYEKYFWNIWKFYTDDRIIFSRSALNGNNKNRIYLDINELYIRDFCINNDLTDILIGRKKTKDFRSWWYDAPLDQIRLFSENYLLNYELIFATRLNDETVTDNNTKQAIKNSRFFIGHLSYAYRYKSSLDGYLMYEKTKPGVPLKRKFLFYGAALRGYGEKIGYWINAGAADGKVYETGNSSKRNGFGFDAGVLIPYSYRLSFAGGYAYGSRKFTQPLIASNYSDYLQKSFKFRYYGNVLNPVLENINILSLYALYHISDYKNIIFSLHSYRQVKAQKTAYNQNYFYETDGVHKNIGNEFDAVFQYLKTKNQKFKIGFGYFLGGDAYKYLKNGNAIRIFANYRYYWK